MESNGLRETITPHEEACFGYECHPSASHENKAGCLELVTAILWGIEQGDDIPPIKMFHFLDSEYQDQYELIYPVNRNSLDQDGGHHRLLAHMLGGHEMDIIVHTRRNYTSGTEIPEYLRVDAKDMRIESRPDVFEFETSCDDNYNIPDGLRDISRYPTWKEVQTFIDSKKDEPITSQDILQSLYR